MQEYRGLLPAPPSSSSSPCTSFYADLLCSVDLNHIVYAANGSLFLTQIPPSQLSTSLSSAPPSSIQLNSLSSQPLHAFSPSQGAVESVTSRLYGADEAPVLAAVTQKGDAIVGTLKAGAEPAQLDVAYQITSPKGWNLESGFAGIDLHPTNKAHVVISRHFQRSVAVYDAGNLIRKFPTSQLPCKVKFVPGEILNSHTEGLGVLEGNELTLWDQRMGEKYGCIKRLSPALGPLYAVDFTKTSVGAVGYDRTIFVFDPRKWSVKGSWSSCVKYEATSMFFSHKDENICFVSGSMDSEIGFGKWTKGGSSTEKRCDGRVVGLSQTSIGDNVVAITSAGSLYLFTEASHIGGRGGDEPEGHQSKRFRPDMDLLEKK